MKAKYEDIKGKVYGYLTVRSRDLSKVGNSIYWNCVCKCGKEKSIEQRSLKRGLTKSCGCFNKEQVKLLNTKPDNFKVRNRVFSRYIKQAMVRGFVFEIPFDEFAQIIESSCYYCGIETSNAYINTSTSEIYRFNGVDRLDNDLGYIEGNVVPCCRICNRSKFKMSEQEFLNSIERIYNHSIKNK